MNNFKITVMTKKMTIEDLAIMVNRGFVETATKEDLKELRTEMHNGFKRVDQKIEALDFKIASVASSWNKDFERLHSWMMEIDERLTKVEAKSGKAK